MRKKNKKEENYVYEIEYASGLLRTNGRENRLIVSNKKLNDGDFVVVEHINCGIFIGRVKGTTLGKTDSDLLQKSFNVEDLEYRYLQDIDVSNWWSNIERKRRIEELKNEMESKFAEIDKQKKFEYYAQIDDDFRDLYSEYKDLEKTNKKEN
jgi:hypothetical protein